MEAIIIQGSSRSNGNTQKIVQELTDKLQCESINLCNYKIGQYDYDYKNSGDDFLALIRKIVEYDIIIFASPVYWYSMSGHLKTFFDRITDCLKTEKETGRKLKGKHMAALACGYDDFEPEGFFVPFAMSAEYLGMKYLGNIHTWVKNDLIEERVFHLIAAFSSRIKDEMNK